MPKAAEAFRTISEVSDLLDLPKHVLRFWENRFPQLRPMKRGGGRRYYRPADLELLLGIQHLLRQSGYTIKGVQKILREQGVEHVKRLGQPAAAEVPAGRSGARAAAKGGRRRASAPAAKTAPVAPPLAVIAAELEACLAMLRPSRGDQRRRSVS